MFREDLFAGAHFIIDCAALKMSHVTKINLMTVKKSSVVSEVNKWHSKMTENYLKYLFII